MKDTSQTITNQYHVDLYGRYPITLVEGKGARVKDSEGNEYIDALAGIAVNSVGHCHPRVVEAVQEQAGKIMHTSNFYYNEPQAELVKLLSEISGLDRSFLCNSGAEAVEGSIKLARKYGHNKGKKGNIISMKNCFHGRTLGTIAMGKEKYQKGFEPMPGGFQQVPMDDGEALKKAVDEDTIGIILEPVQGEGGIRPVDADYLQLARDLCDHYGALLILDEIQCGIGRTGTMFAYQDYDVIPDIVASAKALGGGFPIGAVLANEKAASAISHGEHGTTYGGNPLACAAAAASLNVILDENLGEQARKKGVYFMKKIRNEAEGWPAVKEVRGKGLMIGVELNFKGADVVDTMLDKHVLSNCASNTVMRIVPPLVIEQDELDTVFDVLVESIKEVEEHVEV